MDQNEMSILYRGQSICAPYQVSYNLAKWFQRKSCFRNRPKRNKNCLWWPYLLTDKNGMSNSYRDPSIDASYHASVKFAQLFQSKTFHISTNQKNELPVEAMFVNGSGQNEQSSQRAFHKCILPSFGTFRQPFQRRRLKYEKLTGDG